METGKRHIKRRPGNRRGRMENNIGIQQDGKEGIPEELRRNYGERWLEKVDIIGKDFNARTAEQGSIAWNENEEEEDKRFSKNKIINKQGKNLLAYIEETGLY